MIRRSGRHLTKAKERAEQIYIFLKTRALTLEFKVDSLINSVISAVIRISSVVIREIGNTWGHSELYIIVSSFYSVFTCYIV